MRLRYACLVLVISLACAVQSLHGERPSVAPDHEILDLFGSQAGVPASAPAAAEAEMVISRPGQEERKPLGNGRRLLNRDAGSWHLRDFAPLAVVLGIIAVLALIFKRFMPARRLLGAAGALQVLTRMPISRRQQLMLVRMGRRILLIGVSPDRLTTLAIVDDPEQIASLLGELTSAQPSSLTEEFRRSFAEEAGVYTEEPVESLDQAAGGQVRGLLEKVRRLASKRDVA